MPKAAAQRAPRPFYVLDLDQLPQVVEANGRVYPTYMTLRDAARCFDVALATIAYAIESDGVATIRVGANKYVKTGDFIDWLVAREQAAAGARSSRAWVGFDPPPQGASDDSEPVQALVPSGSRPPGTPIF